MSAARSLAAWIAATSAGLGLFWWVSIRSTWARTGFGSRGRLLAPVNASWEPRWAWSGLLALALLGAFAGGCWLVLRARRLRIGMLLWGLVGFVLVFSSAVVVVRGQTTGYVRTIRPAHPVQYTADVPGVRARGELDVIRGYPTFVREEARSIHTITHPPGPLVLLSVLDRASPDRLVPRALVLMVMAALTVVPAYYLVRRLAGERAALISTLLLCVVPSFVIHSATSVDAALTSVLIGATVLLVRGLDEQTVPALLIGGGAIAVASFFTYAAGFIVAFGVLFALASRAPRAAVRDLAITAAGGLAGLLILWVGIGFDALGSYLATAERLDEVTRMRSVHRPLLYWLLGNPAGWLIMAGLPVAALSVRTLVVRRPAWLLAFIAPLAIFYALPDEVTGLIPGEVERTLLFAYPFGAAAAAVFLVERVPLRAQPPTTALLVALSGVQTIVLEALLLFVW